jgi:hypothetical protein
MGCCAVGTCQDPDCYLCVILPRKFPPVESCGRLAPDGEPCRFVKGHPYTCKGKSAPRAKGNTRDGEAETKRRDPTFTPRRRVGPHR